MKKILFLLTGTLLLSMAACSSHKKRVAKEEIPEEPDSTIMVQLQKVTDDSITFMQLDAQRTRTLGYAEARRNNEVHGTLTIGDTLAVVPTFKQKLALSVVNVSELMGLWMFENGQGTGMRLNAGGAACDVGPSEVTLREWKLRNGHFILTYVPADGSDYNEKADTSTIISLDKEHFSYTLKGNEKRCSKVKGLITK